MPKCDFNKVAFAIDIALWHGCYPVNFLHIFTTPFLKNTSERLLLKFTRLVFIRNLNFSLSLKLLIFLKIFSLIVSYKFSIISIA